MSAEPSSYPTSSTAPGRLLPRIGARVIDAIILTLVGVGLGFAMNFSVAWLVLQAALVFAYFVVCDVAAGATVGKRLVGLEVRGPRGGKPTVGQAAIREAFILLGAVPYVGPLLALAAWIVIAVTINTSPTGRGKHDDLAGGTQVVTT